MKKIIALTLLLSLLLPAALIETVAFAGHDYSPFDDLEYYHVDYDEMEDRISLRIDLDSPVSNEDDVMILPMVNYAGLGSYVMWISVSSQGEFPDELEKVIILVDDVRYNIPAKEGKCVLMCGDIALRMVDEIINSKGDVKIRLSGKPENLDSVISEGQIRVLSELYHAFVGSGIGDRDMMNHYDSTGGIYVK